MKLVKVRFSLVACLLPLFAAGLIFGQQPMALTLNNPINRSLSKGETHQYRLTLAAGEYARVEAKAGSGDVWLTLAAVDGQKLVSVIARRGSLKSKAVMMVAEMTTEYLLRVNALDKNATEVAYALTVLELHTATEADRARSTAERLYAEGDELLVKRAIPNAREKYEASIPFWQAANDLRGEADALDSIGQTQVSLGSYRAALATFDAALEKARAAKDDNLVATVLSDTGTLLNNQYDKQRALAYYLQALVIYRRLGNKYAEARSSINIGNAYTSTGQAQEAIKWYEQARSLCQALNNRSDEGASLFGRGTARIFLENYTEAISDLNAALKIARELGEEYRQGITLTNLASAFVEIRQPQEALTRLDEALPLLRKSNGLSFEAFALHRMGDVWLLLGQPEKAIEYYHQAQIRRQELGENIMEALTTSKISQAEIQRGKLTAALTQSQQALKIVETVRRRFSSPYLSASYSSATHHYYDEHIALLLRLHKQEPAAGYDVQAFQTSERARSRSLMEVLSELGADIRTDAAPELLARETDLQNALDKNARERAKLAQQTETTESKQKLAASEKELLQLTTEYEHVQGQLRDSSPRYAALTQWQPLTLAAIQRQVLKSDSLLLEYLVGRDHIYLFAVTNDPNIPLKVFEIADKATIESAAAFFKRRKDETGAQFLARLSHTNPEFQQTLRTLSAKLIAPVQSLLGTKKLLIASDGALQYVPFAVLPDPVNSITTGINRAGKSRPPSRKPPIYTPLLAKHEIVSVPSASTIGLLRNTTGKHRMANAEIAVLADPVFDAEDERVKGLPQPTFTSESSRADRVTLSPDIAAALRDAGFSNEPVKLSRLAASGTEARGIAELVPEEEGLLALGFDANRERVLNGLLEHYRYIHFATHAFVDDQHPALSGLALSMVDLQGREQSGFLRLSDIFKLKLSADLVVLGACRTGLGKELRGEGMIGLTQGFMYAGVPRVMVSLWDIDDHATAKLMKRFYYYLLQQHLSPSAALRQAQLERWQQNSSPFFWAAFILQGDPE